MYYKTFYPSQPLKPYIHHYDYIELPPQTACHVIPRTLPVMGLYANGFGTRTDETSFKPLRSEFFGLQDSPRAFYSPNSSRMVTIHFKDLHVCQFLNLPMNEAFNTEISLINCCKRQILEDLEDCFMESKCADQAIQQIETFLIKRLKPTTVDPLVQHALLLIRQSAGNIAMTTLSDRVNSSQSLLEKRFRKVLGTSPKRFSSLVRFNSVIYDHQPSGRMTERAYRAGYFDQAHFNREFKLFTGESPKQLFKNMENLGEFRIFDLKVVS